jgi:hypothetical protein
MTTLEKLEEHALLEQKANDYVASVVGEASAEDLAELAKMQYDTKISSETKQTLHIKDDEQTVVMHKPSLTNKGDGDKIEKSSYPELKGEEPKFAEVSEESFKRLGESFSFKKETDYKPMSFSNPLEMYIFFSDMFQSGERIPHKWQVEVNLFLAQKHTQAAPCRFYLRAANSSGKDAYVIAPFAVWFALCKIRSRVIITSSSYAQLEGQTESYIRSLCFMINTKLVEMGGNEAFVVRKNHIICTLTGSEIKLFATDDAGKAEGYHPFPDWPNSEMAIIANEAKSIKEEIFTALRRCLGYSYWIEISSPGQMSGHFYRLCRQAKQWGIAEYEPNEPYTRKVTSYDCLGTPEHPHISIGDIEQAKKELGEHSAAFRSIYLAEFTSLDDAVIITRESLEKCLDRKAHHITLGIGKRCGVDLAAGGDECTAYVFDGNKFYDKFCFYEKDTTITVDALIAFFSRMDLQAENIFADDGGVGHSIIDQLHRKGWPVNRVINQSRALNTAQYGNRGAELWFKFKRLIEECMIILPKDDPKLIDQLSSRYYKQSESLGKIVLESKKEARGNGHGSPDRGDAVVLAFVGIGLDDLIDNYQTQISNDSKKLNPKEILIGNTDSMLTYMDNKTFESYDKGLEHARQTITNKNSRKGRSFGSLSSLMKGLKHK